MFCWSLLTSDPTQTPFLMGVSDDLARCQRLAEPYLLAGRACVCVIEAVRAAMAAHDLSRCYVRTGRYWIGQLLADTARVGWSEQNGLPGPRLPGDGHAPGWTHATSDLH